MYASIPVKKTDFIIIGSGIAGLRAAIELSHQGDVFILSKDEPSESNTEYAQGGIAVALSDEDRISFHYEDTIAAGDGLCNEEVVKILVSEGPARISELIAWGTEFDRNGTKLAFTREAAHSKKRILHARGDSTGKEIIRALLKKVRTYKNIYFMPFCYTINIIVEENNCHGIAAINEKNGDSFALYGRAVLFATGGCGRVYAETTNPPFATGDGMAIAYSGGAEMMDMEFVQFHPTSLYLPDSPRFLLTEALRGEGAYLLNGNGERFMKNYHPMAELAPRDVVSRSIIQETERTGTRWVYLDLTHLDAAFIKNRFPQIYHTCLTYNLDITKEKIPVHPAAHYMMGGIKTDIWGKTSLKGLYAAGETACTGVHGANRLASNSLLEGLVFGARCGQMILKDDRQLPPVPKSYTIKEEGEGRIGWPSDRFELLRKEINRIMWEKAGIIRNAPGLKEAQNRLQQVKPPSLMQLKNRFQLETLNILTIAKLITSAAIFREESRGGHYRSDYPAHDESQWKHHSIIVKGREPYLLK
jgi:L-aspartate oxidase